MTTEPSGPPASRLVTLVRSLLGSTRFFLLIAVVGSFVASIAILVVGGIETFSFVVSLLAQQGRDEKELAVAVIQIIDLFLLGTVFYIIALGLYQLFIDNTLPVPRWLEFTTLDDLKDNLLRVVVVLLAVLFLGQLVQWKGGTDVLALGAAVALVIGAISLFLWLGHATRQRPRGDGEG